MNINDPVSGKWHLINSHDGKKLLQKYLRHTHKVYHEICSGNQTRTGKETTENNYLKIIFLFF